VDDRNKDSLNEKLENIVLIPCSGSEYHGELARQVAIHLSEKSELSNIISMTCTTIFFKNVFLGKDNIVEITRNHLKHSFIVVINGCNTACTSQIYEHLDIKPDLIISVQDVIPKQRVNLNDLDAFRKLKKLSDIDQDDLNLVTSHILSELEKKGLKIETFNFT